MFSKSVLVFVLATLSSASAFAPVPLNTRTVAVARTPLYLADAADEDDIDVDEPAPEDFIVNVGDIEEPETSDESGPAWEALNERVEAMRIKHRRSDNDTGSPEFQVAGMTERISYLTEHLKQHPKDFSTRRGLVALVNKRRRLLNYLFSEDTDRYVAVVQSLGIRHKAPSPVQSRVEKYGRFPGQKPNKYRNKQSS
mmetsp:Transcript_3376/g.3930  ORF Transcript_3376/g.3930 Transcript_3376/m.3930 type:complete len:197 (+) Transcript_3376:56-646(+)|eukprot:CAMPEP_0204638590 /NCGR_PEP_ID=MMETSP0717-20131115/39862_1 /ASSEMBLY_ACC=CAM_ASM_000666 /TAXON_ID=230516 /ORGANISM="Chaetoceros curvisetus" /LENGTH=196 /DNA_ID=CAMNT_0051658401 /DNA_START=131 /DNA_END=721 /DNA_ORIENTATION=+